MGRYDDIRRNRLRADLLHLAALIRRLDRRGELLDSVPRLIKLMGDMRQKLFAYEVRAAEHLRPRPPEGDVLGESERVIREAREREREMLAEWERPWTPDGDEDEE